MASADKFTITIKGKSAHGANPQDSVDPIVVAAECVEALQTIRSRRVHPQEGSVLSVGSIHGGTRFNIIADEVVLVGTMRSRRKNAHGRVPVDARNTWRRDVGHGATFELVTSESAGNGERIAAACGNTTGVEAIVR